MTQASEIARRLGDTFAQYANEYLASIDGRCEGVTLSETCGWFANCRRLLSTVEAGEYASFPGSVRQAILDVPGHVMKTHPEFAHLFFEDPGPAANALQDQLNAVRKEAEQRFGSQ